MNNEKDILHRLDELEKEVSEVEFKNSYTDRHTRGEMKLVKPIVITLILLLSIVMLVFYTNAFVYIESDDIAVVSTVHSVNRETIMEVTQNVKEKKEEDSQVAANLSLEGVESMEFNVPIMTCEEIGGQDSSMSKSTRKCIIGTVVTYESYTVVLGMTKNCASPYLAAKADVDDNTGFVTYKDRYLAAIGSYFLPGGKKYISNSYDSNGYCFDVILKDGTTIPCIKADTKSDSHTNSSKFSTLLEKDFKHIFQYKDGSVLEITGKANSNYRAGNGDTPCNNFKKKFNITSDNPIVKIVMYNKFWEDL